VFTATLRSKCRGADYRRQSSSIDAFVYVACLQSHRLATDLSVSIACFSFDNSSEYPFYFREAGENNNACRILVGEPEGKKAHGRFRVTCGWEDDIGMYFGEIGRGFI
jgi:hypothetical protein